MKRMKTITALALSVLLLFTLLTGCGSSAKESYNATAGAMADEAYAYDGGYAMEVPAEAMYEEAASGSTVPTDDTGESFRSGLKIIKTGNLSIETESYEETDSIIRARLAAVSGVLAESSVSGTKGSRWASYVVRVPSAAFDEFFYSVSGECVVTYQAISSEDVTEQYTDLSTRLETAKKKYQRLLELLDQAETLTDIYSLQSEISEVEYEIDSLTGTLNGLDSRVSYSTIYIDVNETTHTVNLPEEQSFGAKLKAAFRNGTENAVEGIQNLVISLAAGWFGILLFLLLIAVVLIVVRVIIVKQRSREKKTAELKFGQSAEKQKPAEAPKTTELKFGQSTERQKPEEDPDAPEKPQE